MKQLIGSGTIGFHWCESGKWAKYQPSSPFGHLLCHQAYGTSYENEWPQRKQIENEVERNEENIYV